MPPLSRQTLTALPSRAFSFLHAIGTSRGIRAAMSANGYGAEMHERGWALLDRVSHRRCTFGERVAVTESPIDLALGKLHEWHRTVGKRLRAAIAHEHPSYVAELFVPATMGGPLQSLLSVNALLDALDKLERSRGVEARQVLATLHARGLTKEERASLARSVDEAQRLPSKETRATAGAADKLVADGDLHALHGWYTEWSTVARGAFDRVDWLERLGLKKRKAVARAAKGS